ncbi:putative MFS family arabinose efflux permease [Murinocardiopsis flavida]|uniref:Putative MFS family arabinose efflux permease n=1 Tax=Murinocardiopsis flavida TaxID=645275 RepID=A0A2P8DNQ2_9ACTN|nr:MFS transporter [Murinocardiopsis flavida]PSK98819.1 putative MFS family arabinose efflux permease [Murinocardiopsis flavida]
MNPDAPETPRFPSRGLPAWLLCLLLAAFAVGTDDFVVAGVLPEVATGLRVSEAAAGQLVTVFSITYAVAAPVLAVATARLPRRRLFVGAMLVFALANVGAALAPTYAVLMAFRVVAALAAAAITPAAFAIAAALAPRERMGRAIGTVAAGLTLALALGVPVGTWLGAAFGWRSTFAFVVVLAVAVLAATPVFLPDLPGAAEIGLRRRFRALTRPAILLGVSGTVLGATGGLMTYTYIAPIVRDLTGAGTAQLAALIAVVGVAGAIGTDLGGRATDRWGADRALLVTIAGQVAATGVLAAIGFAGDGASPLPLVAAVFAVWGLAGWAFNPPMNTRMLELAGPAGTEVVALNTSGLYVGIALGGALGGAAVAGYGGIGVTVASAVIGLATIVLLAASVVRYAAPRAAAGPERDHGPAARQT